MIVQLTRKNKGGQASAAIIAVQALQDELEFEDVHEALMTAVRAFFRFEIEPESINNSCEHVVEWQSAAIRGSSVATDVIRGSSVATDVKTRCSSVLTDIKTERNSTASGVASGLIPKTRSTRSLRIAFTPAKPPKKPKTSKKAPYFRQKSLDTITSGQWSSLAQQDNIGVESAYEIDDSDVEEQYEAPPVPSFELKRDSSLYNMGMRRRTYEPAGTISDTDSEGNKDAEVYCLPPESPGLITHTPVHILQSLCVMQY